MQSGGDTCKGKTGYLHPEYVKSLAEFGDPQWVPRSGGWVLRRKIPGSWYHDAMGSYPLFTCSDCSEKSMCTCGAATPILNSFTSLLHDHC